VLAGEDGGVGAPQAEPSADYRLTASLSGFSPRARFPRMGPATWANDVPLETARNRSAPMACGSNVDQARPLAGGSGAPRRGPCLARRPPPAAPDKRAPPGRSPCLGGALAGSGLGTSPIYAAVRSGYSVEELGEVQRPLAQYFSRTSRCGGQVGS
jgi:hypothetical protein